MTTGMHQVYTIPYSSKKSFYLERRMFKHGDYASKMMHLTPSLDDKPSSQVSWKVCLMLDNNDGVYKLCKAASIWLELQPGFDKIRAKAKVHVRQVSDEATDLVSYHKVPWMIHTSEECTKFDKDIQIITGVQQVFLDVRITWEEHDTLIRSFYIFGKTPDPCIDPRSNLVARLEALHSSSKDSEVVFIVGDEEIVAHLPILATASEVFEKMFQVDTQDKLTRRVQVEDASPKGFRNMLRSLYTGQEPEWETTSIDDLLELAYLAHKYGLKLLQARCARRMVLLIQVDNVCTLLKAAITLDFQSVVDRGIQCLNNNREVLKSKEWTELARKDPHIVIEILFKMI